MNPHVGTLGSAVWARFSVQSGLAYELDARQMPSNWSTGYWPLGTAHPGLLPDPSDLYGTEVFELNTNLLARAVNLTSGLTLNDSSVAQHYRKRFDYAPANQPPSVTQGDACVSAFRLDQRTRRILTCTPRSLCSDAYWAGNLLAWTWGNYTSLMTKGEGKYATTAQEDNATLEAMVRGEPLMRVHHVARAGD